MSEPEADGLEASGAPTRQDQHSSNEPVHATGAVAQGRVEAFVALVISEPEIRFRIARRRLGLAEIPASRLLLAATRRKRIRVVERGGHRLLYPHLDSNGGPVGNDRLGS